MSQTLLGKRRLFNKPFYSVLFNVRKTELSSITGSVGEIQVFKIEADSWVDNSKKPSTPVNSTTDPIIDSTDSIEKLEEIIVQKHRKTDSNSPDFNVRLCIDS